MPLKRMCAQAMRTVRLHGAAASVLFDTFKALNPEQPHSLTPLPSDKPTVV